MSLKDYKYVDSGKKHTIVEHRGEKFLVAHEGLDKATLQKVQQFAQGGVVEEAPEEEVPVASSSGGTNLNFDDQGGDLPPTVITAPAPQEAPQQQQASPAQLPSSMAKAFETQKQAIGAESKALQGQNTAASAVFDQAKQGFDQLQLNYANNLKSIQDERQTLQQKFDSQEIHHASVYENKSTGGQIAAALGLVLGGIGSGLTGGPNQALELVKKRLDQDFEAQLKNLGKTQNLLTMNYQKEGDLAKATLVTKDMQLTSLKSQLDSVMARTQNPVIAANAQKARSIIDVEQAQMGAQLAMLNSQVRAEGGFTPQGQQNPMLGLNDKFSERTVKVPGGSYQAYTKDDAEHVKTVQDMHEELSANVNKLKQLGPEALIPGSGQYKEAQSIMGRLKSQVPQFQNSLGKNARMTDTEVKLAEEQLGNPKNWGDFFNGAVKNNALLDDADRSLEVTKHSRLKGYRGSVQSGSKKGFQ